MMTSKANEIILTKDAIGPNLKHITRCMEFLSGYNDQESFENMDGIKWQQQQQQREQQLLKEKQCELKTKNEELKQTENELSEKEQYLNDKEEDLKNMHKTMDMEIKRYKRNLQQLTEDQELFERQKQEQMTLILFTAKKNTIYANQLKQREKELLNREKSLLQREHALYQREKALLHKEHKAKLQLKIYPTNNHK